MRLLTDEEDVGIVEEDTKYRLRLMGIHKPFREKTWDKTSFIL